ncbi:hypothetical protein AB0H86_04575 [Streptomyces sp. NPDC050997]|uniref:hypothetical protein n=1 Tax=Streptomyces sp. NPDC050997 TaxID=3155519 RepID=UPI0034348EC1
MLGYSPVKAGPAFLPLAVTALLGNGVGVTLAAKYGNRWVILAGMPVMVAVACFALLTTVDADSGFTAPEIALGLLGLGACLAMPAVETGPAQTRWNRRRPGRARPRRSSRSPEPD